MKKLMFATVFASAAAAFATEYNKIGFEGYSSGDYAPPYTLVNGVVEKDEAGNDKVGENTSATPANRMVRP